jgi:hypothetical protein
MKSRCVGYHPIPAPGSDWDPWISRSCHCSWVGLIPRYLQFWLTFASRYLIQYRKLGVEQASVSGQEFYPIYILAPQSLLFLSPSTFCCSCTYRIACSYRWLLFCVLLDSIPRSYKRSQRTAKRSRYFPLPSCKLLFFYKGNNRFEATGDRFWATFQYFESAAYSNSASPLY